MPEYSYACDACDHKWSIFCHRSEYKERKKCPCCKKIKPVHRDYEEDNVYGSYSYSLSETKTIGHYADKQSKKFGKNKVEDMLREQKTKQTDSLSGKLNENMSKMEKPKDPPKWTKDTGKKKKRKRNR